MTDPKVDKYIENAEEFAKPILKHLRKLVHQACPEVEEVIKWGMPAFYYKGPLCSMASFKHHAVFGFWKESLIPGMKGYIKEKEAMGSWGRITDLKGLPPDKDVIKFIHLAMELNEKGIKAKKEQRKTARNLEIPDYFKKALNKNKKAKETFDNFSYTNKNEYVSWVVEAKTEETRDKRLEQAVKWLSEGKIRHWKYMQKSY
jgi:uncharacterized protein YdeI (YjbR/CyaY-like superfamily)